MFHYSSVCGVCYYISYVASIQVLIMWLTRVAINSCILYCRARRSSSICHRFSCTSCRYNWDHSCNLSPDFSVNHGHYCDSDSEKKTTENWEKNVITFRRFQTGMWIVGSLCCGQLQYFCVLQKLAKFIACLQVDGVAISTILNTNLGNVEAGMNEWKLETCTYL